MLKPYPYQQRGVIGIEKRGLRTLLADDPGLGKTLQALWVLKRNPEACLPALVVCPAIVKHNWEKEASTHFGLSTDILESQTPRRMGRGFVPLVQDLTIINYDILHYWQNYLLKCGFKMAIVDEVHMIANRSKRTTATQKVCKSIPHLICLSGTPLLNRPIELYNTIHLIAPEMFSSRWNFARRHCAPQLKPWGWEYKGASRLKELNEKLKPIMIRRLKRDVMKELPDKVRRVVTLPLSDPAEYQTAKRDFLLWLTRTEGVAKAKSASTAEQIVQMTALKKLAAQLKIDAIVEWVNHFFASHEPGEKLVVFGHHKAMLRTLEAKLKHKSVRVDGSITGHKRRAAVAQFADDKKTVLFLGNTKACGVGMNGLQVAQTAAMVELPWQPGECTQAEDRLHRIGQKGTSWIYYLVAAGTIEEPLCEVIQKKQGILSKVLDGGVQPGDFDVFTMLKQKLLEGNK